MTNPIANRYAHALFEVAKEKGILEQVNDELQNVKTVVEATPSFNQFLAHPKVPATRKKELIQTSFQGVLSETSLHTLLLLIESKRIDSLIPMIDAFKSLSNEAQGIAEAIVYSAKPLSEEEKTELALVFAAKIGKAKLVVNNEVNPDLIGGVKIRIGDRIYDGSVKAQLDKLERQLIAGTR